MEDQPIGKVGGIVRRYSNSFWLTSRQIRSQRNRNTTWPTHPPSPFYTAHPVEKMIDNHEKMTMKVIYLGYISTLYGTSFLDRICFRQWSWGQGWACLSFCFHETIAEWSFVDLQYDIWFRWSAIADGQLLRTTRDCQRWRPKGTGRLGNKRENIHKYSIVSLTSTVSNSLCKVTKDGTVLLHGGFRLTAIICRFRANFLFLVSSSWDY